eukprot:3770332-Amphidinium_carterae.1
MEAALVSCTSTERGAGDVIAAKRHVPNVSKARSAYAVGCKAYPGSGQAYPGSGRAGLQIN